MQENKVLKFDIIMFCMSEWQDWYKKGVVNRNWHVLNQLLNKASVGKILAVDFLPYTKKRALRSYLENQLFGVGGRIIKRYFTSQLRQIADNFFVYSQVDSAFRKEAKVYQKIENVLKWLGFQNLILWSYFPMFCGYFDAFDAKLKVFDAVDNWIEHPNFKNYRRRLQENYNMIDQKADLIFTVSRDLVQLFPNNKCVHWVPNGVDVEHFSSTLRTLSSEREVQNLELLDIPHPIIGYAGIIQDRVDLKLIKYLAEQNPDKSVVLVGMIWPEANIELIENMKNVYLLGHKPYQELPKYIQQFDVAIIPHKINEFTRSMNPLKLYEYLACGKPVVTTPIAGVEKFEGLIEIVSTYKEFNQGIQKMLARDNEIQRVQRVNAAKQHSWKSKVNQMFSYINQVI